MALRSPWRDAQVEEGAQLTHCHPAGGLLTLYYGRE